MELARMSSSPRTAFGRGRCIVSTLVVLLSACQHNLSALYPPDGSDAGLPSDGASSDVQGTDGNSPDVPPSDAARDAAMDHVPPPDVAMDAPDVGPDVFAPDAPDVVGCIVDS